MSDRNARRLLNTLSLPDDAGIILERPKYHRSSVFEALVGICDRLRVDCPSDALPIAQILPQLAQKIDPHDLGLRVRAQAVLGAAHRVLCQLDEAQAAYDAVQAVLEAAPPLAQVEFLSRYTSLLRNQRLFAQAHQALDRGIQLFRLYGDLSQRKPLGLLLIARGLVYDEQGSASEALAALGESLSHLCPHKDEMEYSLALQNLATTLFDVLDPAHFRKAATDIARARKSLTYKPAGLARHKLSWAQGLAYSKLGLGRQAEALLRRARAGFEKLDLPQEVAIITLDLASLAINEGNAVAAQKRASEAYRLFASLPVPRETLLALNVWIKATPDEPALLKIRRTLLAASAARLTCPRI